MAAEFIYPTHGNYSSENNDRMINVFDTLYVQYRSSWLSLNLTLFCLQGTTSSSYQYINVQGNPILATGLYRFGTIQSYNFGINQYPTMCNLKLTKYRDNDVGLNGENFWVTSDAASSTTFQPGSSTSASITTTQSGTATGQVSVVTTTISSPTSSQTLGASSAGLSTGAQAGIGVGVALAALGILAFIASFLLLRRRRGRSNAKGEISGSALIPPGGAMYQNESYKSGMVVSGPAELENSISDGVIKHELP